MKLLLTGIRASGKGTQAKLLAKKLNIPHISSGDVFRDIDISTPLGKKVRSFMDNGEYVPDDLVLKLIIKKLAEEDITQGFILDGFPRTLEQAQAFDKKETFDKVILIDISRKEAILRTSGRRVCSKCDLSYNIYTAPKPQQEGICDSCRAKLYQRKDETKKAALRRIQKDLEEIDPLIEFYESQGIVVTINGKQPIEKVHQDIVTELSITS